ncbi:MAG: hypothetical protein M1826_003341 [Phylliscum demangeonii]|nr:MAG: hypothetical protein M1826_003341 [Phylliscum demangeonii]
MAELNDYEYQRAQNIAKNQALLRDLQLNAARAGLGLPAPAKSASRPKPAVSDPSDASQTRKKRAPAAKKIQAEVGPRRTSSRLAGLQADSEGAKRKAEEELAAVQEAARIKRQRVSADLDLSAIVVAGKEWDQARNVLVEVTRRAQKDALPLAEPDIQTTDDQTLRALRQRMSGLRLYDGFEPNRIKITPERIYSLAFHPTPNKALVFAGDKLGNLGIFDASQAVKAERDDDDDGEEADEPAAPAVTAFKLHARTISAFVFPASTGNTLLSASYDSSIRSLDLSASKSTELYAPGGRKGHDANEDDDDPITGIDVPANDPSTVYFSTMNGLVGRHDTRSAADSNRGGTELYRLSEKKIGGFSLHPSQPHLLATASLDRHLRIWDLRRISGRGEARLPALLGEHQSRLSVSHASWNAAGQLATASYDDTVKIYDFSRTAAHWSVGHDIAEAEGMQPSTVVPHNNQTGRWVTILRAQWQLHPPDGIPRFCIGNMNRFVDVYTSQGQLLVQLGGEAITAVPAVAQFHPSLDWIAGGTASGKLCLWM